MFHKEGHNIIAVSFITIAIINLISRNFIENSTLNYFIGIITIIIFVLILQFFRNKHECQQIGSDCLIK